MAAKRAFNVERAERHAARPAPIRFPSDTTPEGLIAIEHNGVADILILSDDGTQLVDGQPAKGHPDPARRTFRGFLLSGLKTQ